MNMQPPSVHYRFLQWSYEPERRLLQSAECEIRLKPLLDRLLRHFLDEPGKVLGRDYLIEQVWTRSQVNDEVLSRAIAELRALLGDDARDPRFIETLSKGGYRWIAPVSPDAASQQPQAVGESKSPARGSFSSHRRRVAFALLLLTLVPLGLWLHGQRSGDVQRSNEAHVLGLLEARPLAANAELDLDARFTPTGQVIYVRSERESGASELVIVDPKSRAERILWQDPLPLRNPAASLDGREVAVIRRSKSGCELWSVVLVDARRRQLAACANEAEGVEWVDGDSGIIFTGAAIDAAHAPGLVRLDLKSGQSRALTTPELSEGAHVDPRLSADARRLAYASKFGGEGQLWLSDWPDLHARRALLKRAEPIYGHAFEPDGKALWVAGDLTRYRALHRLVPGSAPVLIGGRGALSIDLAQDGSAVWSDARHDGDIELRRSGRDDWEAIARTNRYESQPEFSADGKHIALVSNRDGSESIVVYNMENGTVLPLALEPRFRWVRPTWSARDQSLILTAYEDVETRLYRYRLDRGVLETVPNVEPGAFHGVELADRLFFLSGHRTRQSALMQLRPGNAQAEQLPFGIVQAYRASIRWLAWRREGSRALHFAPLPSLSPMLEVARVDEGAVEAFALAGDSLYFVDKGALWKKELPDGQAVEVAVRSVPGGSSPGLAASAAGDLAVVRLTDLSIDLMIAGPPADALRTRFSEP